MNTIISWVLLFFLSVCILRSLLEIHSKVLISKVVQSIDAVAHLTLRTPCSGPASVIAVAPTSGSGCGTPPQPDRGRMPESGLYDV